MKFKALFLFNYPLNNVHNRLLKIKIYKVKLIFHNFIVRKPLRVNN